MEALRLSRVSKRYGDCVSVRLGDVAFATGRVHAIVGENGAGKSTLLKMAAGLVVPDSGEVTIEGQPLAPHTAAEALRRGVGLVQQHFALVPVFTVLENMVLGAEPRGKGLGRFWMSFDRVRAAATRAFEQIGANVPLDARVSDLGVGDRQRVEIARILFRGARTLLLDEPTAVLTSREVDALYAKLRMLAGAGCAVVVVTHKLDEVLAHADVVTVMRAGDTIETRSLRRGEPEKEHDALARAIMGGLEPPPALLPIETRREFSGAALRAVDLRFRTALHGVSFEVGAGEIVGIAGVEGNGQEELVAVLGGVNRADAGHLEGVGAPADARRPAAIVYGDRHGDGLVLSATVRENLVFGELAEFSTLGVVHGRAITREAERRRDMVGIVPPTLDTAAEELSGGNQQKIVVARALARAAKGASFVIFAHPTRGVDIGAARAIHELIRRVVAADDTSTPVAGVLVLSSDLDELRSLCHRILVLSRGRIVADLPPTTSDLEMGEYMLGQRAVEVRSP